MGWDSGITGCGPVGPRGIGVERTAGRSTAGMGVRWVLLVVSVEVEREEGRVVGVVNVPWLGVLVRCIVLISRGSPRWVGVIG